jgi:hypothetical protein
MTRTNWPALVALTAVGLLAGCSNNSKKPDLSRNLRSALDQAGLKKVSVSQDRDKGIGQNLDAATSVAYVQQVVNELQVKNQKATSRIWPARSKSGPD